MPEGAADLLCHGDLANLRKCENHDCILYLYDTTKNHTRRWRSTAGCGNRAKAAAFYQRKKKRIGGKVKLESRLLAVCLFKVNLNHPNRFAARVDRFVHHSARAIINLICFKLQNAVVSVRVGDSHRSAA